MDDLISRQAAIEHLKKRLYETALNNITEHPYYEEMADNRVDVWLNELQSVDDYDVVAEYCRKRRLVIITADLFEKIKREYVGEEHWIR